jgi:hypothetical protein
MKRIYILISLILGAMFFVTSCQDDDQELGATLSKSEIDYEVTQDFEKDPGGNTVILKNNTPGTVSMWDYGTGRSTRMQDTVHFAFKGSYVIKFSALTAGGVVECDSVIVEVTADNLNYVNDPLWTLLTNGVGNEKTWIPDNGKYGLGTGFLSYADPGVSQLWGNFTPNWEPGNGDVGITETDVSGEMTFKLMGGPYITTVKPNEAGGNESGTFYLDADNHTLSTTDATIVRPAGVVGNASNWNANLRILVLTENQLRIAVYRTNNEGPWWYILNYVSKEYAANYVPVAQPDPNFNFGNQLEFLAGSSATTWKFETNSPFNWTDLNGKFLNEGWNAVTDYPGWTGYDAAAVSGINDARITFTKTGDVTVVQDNGTVQQGFYSIEEAKNLITFESIKPSLLISGGWVTATTTDLVKDGAGNIITGDNQWKIVKTKTISGVTTEVWFGKRDPGKKEYMVYHFILASGIPDIKSEMIKGLCGKATGESSRTFKIDVNHPVDWTNLDGVGWTVPGVQEGWYWSADIAASVKNQTLTFSQVNGIVTASKKDEDGNVSTSPVTIDPVTRMITMPDIDIIKFGAGSWLPTGGPDFKWVKGEYNKVATEGLWLGVLSKPTEYTAYHYILK